MKTTISIVVPVYMGESYLEDLCKEISSLRERLEKAVPEVEVCEAIFVSDEAIDNSERVLRELETRYKWVRLVCLSKNSGQHPATTAGILHSSGDWVVTLDEDLQHDPKFIPAMLCTAILNNNDVVYARPLSGPHQSVYRDLMSSSFKKFVGMITSNKHITKFNSFRLLRGSIARSAAAVTGHDGYFDVVLCWFTGRISCVDLDLVDRRFLERGQSGYRFRSLLSHARRMLVSSQTKTLRIGGGLGIFALGFSVFFGARVLFSFFFDEATVAVRGWSSLAMLSLFFGGITLFLLGILFEYVSIMVLHNQGKPTFFVIDRRSDDSLRPILDKLKSV
jgi:glycosyltransferase involved in cell wall biosynthesis